eukprot:g27553.t1
MSKPRSHGLKLEEVSSSFLFRAGEFVDYYSSSTASWIPAKVLAQRADGLYDLDCKTGVPPTKVRAATFSKPEYEVGAIVEFYSSTAGLWLPATVKMYNGIAGTYDLDCKLSDAVEESGGSSSSMRPLPMQPQQEGPRQLIRVTRRGTSWHFELCEDTMKGTETAETPLTKDCEGFGSTDSDKTRDAKLMSLCMLLSSVFLLNTKGVLSEGLFNALSLVCSLATYVEQGQDTSKPALLWLLRDFLLELVDEKGRRMTPDEYLESSLRKTPRDAVESQRSQAAREVRETLLQRLYSKRSVMLSVSHGFSLARSFPDRRCVTLCQPVIDEEQLRQLSEVPFEHLRPEFRRGFQDLQTQLLRLAMSHPKTVQGEAICASAWAAMLRKLVAALNEGTALNVQHSACNDLSAELQSRVLEEFQKVKDGGPLPRGRHLPVSDETLAASLKAQWPVCSL